jgi:hypothetical protein
MNAAIEREVDAKLEAELEARKAKMRADIAVRMRREAGLAHLDRVNARHPIETPLAGLTEQQEAARRARAWPSGRGPLAHTWTPSTRAPYRALARA